jgi:hypothetical protein
MKVVYMLKLLVNMESKCVEIPVPVQASNGVEKLDVTFAKSGCNLLSSLLSA